MVQTSVLVDPLWMSHHVPQSHTHLPVPSHPPSALATSLPKTKFKGKTENQTKQMRKENHHLDEEAVA